MEKKVTKTKKNGTKVVRTEKEPVLPEGTVMWRVRLYNWLGRVLTSAHSNILHVSANLLLPKGRIYEVEVNARVSSPMTRAEYEVAEAQHENAKQAALASLSPEAREHYEAFIQAMQDLSEPVEERADDKPTVH